MLSVTKEGGLITVKGQTPSLRVIGDSAQYSLMRRYGFSRQHASEVSLLSVSQSYDSEKNESTLKAGISREDLLPDYIWAHVKNFKDDEIRGIEGATRAWSDLVEAAIWRLYGDAKIDYVDLARQVNCMRQEGDNVLVIPGSSPDITLDVLMPLKRQIALKYGPGLTPIATPSSRKQAYVIRLEVDWRYADRRAQMTSEAMNSLKSTLAELFGNENFAKELMR